MAAQTIAAAGETRRHLLLADRIDDAALGRAEKNCSDAASAHAGIEDALDHVTAQIAGIEARIAGEADQAERERVATEIEARADRLAASAVNLDVAAENYGELRREMAKVADEVGPRDPITLASPTGRILRGADHLSGAVPRTEMEEVLGRPVSAYHAAHSIVEGMKAQAAGIRSGELPAILSVRPEPYIHVAIPDVSITLSRPVQYHGRFSVLQHVMAGGVTLPEPVAAAAIKAGIGFPDGSTDAAAIRRIAGREAMGTHFKRREDGVWIADPGPIGENGKPVPHEMFVPLPVNLYEYEQAERARMRTAA